MAKAALPDLVRGRAALGAVAVVLVMEGDELVLLDAEVLEAGEDLGMEQRLVPGVIEVLDDGKPIPRVNSFLPERLPIRAVSESTRLWTASDAPDRAAMGPERHTPLLPRLLPNRGGKPTREALSREFTTTTAGESNPTPSAK